MKVCIRFCCVLLFVLPCSCKWIGCKQDVLESVMHIVNESDEAILLFNMDWKVSDYYTYSFDSFCWQSDPFPDRVELAPGEMLAYSGVYRTITGFNIIIPLSLSVGISDFTVHQELKDTNDASRICHPLFYERQEIGGNRMLFTFVITNDIVSQWIDCAKKEIPED